MKNDYDKYKNLLVNAKNIKERDKILKELGISSPKRIIDLDSYISLLNRKSNKNLEDKTDFELLKLLPKNKKLETDQFYLRKDLLEYVKNNLNTKTQNKDEYSKCLEKAQNRAKQGKLKLCPEGYCTAKMKFDVYPSAYANAYAAQVCKGTKADYRGNTENYYGTKEKPKDSELTRWFEEEWVNVCEEGFPPCGRSGKKKIEAEYPYCRPKNKLPGTKVKTLGELTEKDIEKMCKLKQSLPQGIEGKPTRIYLSSLEQ